MTKYKKNLNILVTSAGVDSAQNIVKALKKSKKFKINIICSDQDKYVAGIYPKEKFFQTPSANSKFFLKKIKEIVRINKINFIFPCHSSEILLFSKNKRVFEKLEVGIIVPDENTVKICNSKKSFLKFLKNFGYKFPKTFNSLSEISQYPVFIKPEKGSSSKGAHKINNLKELKFYAKFLKDGFIVQKFENSTEYTVDRYVNKNSFLMACVPRERIRVRDGKSIIGKTHYDTKIFSLIKKLLGDMDYQGPCNVQIFKNKDNLKLIEINPRMSAGGLLLTLEAGINIPELMLRDYYFGLKDIPLDFKPNIYMYKISNEIFE